MIRWYSPVIRVIPFFLLCRLVFPDKFVDGCAEVIIETINKIKYGTELQSYKTGSVNGVKTRIALFTKGVRSILDGR